MLYYKLALLRHLAPLTVLCLAVTILVMCVTAQWRGKTTPLAHPARPARAPLPRPITTPITASARLLAKLGTGDAAFIAALHQAADDAAVSLDEVSYQQEQERTLPVTHLQANFTLVDSYANIRHFLNTLLSAQPNATLEGFSCTRENIDVTEVSCVIRLGAYFKQSGGTVAQHGG